MDSGILKKARRVSDLSCSELAKMLGKSQPTVLKWEKNINAIPFGELCKWYSVVSPGGKDLIRNEVFIFFNQENNLKEVSYETLSTSTNS